MDNRTITIKTKESGDVLASGTEANDVFLLEGTWYFDIHAVDMTHLIVTERTYICPYKGTCYWIDLAAPDQQAQNVAFIYFQVNSGYTFIKDRIGFFAGRREATLQETG